MNSLYSDQNILVWLPPWPISLTVLIECLTACFIRIIDLFLYKLKGFPETSRYTIVHLFLQQVVTELKVVYVGVYNLHVNTNQTRVSCDIRFYKLHFYEAISLLHAYVHLLTLTHASLINKHQHFDSIVQKPTYTVFDWALCMVLENG